jgi:hypothetical protein
MKRFVILVAILALGVSGVFLADYLTVGKPVAGELATDHRNREYTLIAHQHYRIPTGTLVLNLRSVDSASPADLLRGVFQAAEVFHRRDRTFEQVVLANQGKAVFLLDGRDFHRLGRERSFGENPIYMMRTFPSQLKRPNGAPAYQSWSGGFLGVMSAEMEDVNQAMRTWVRGGN